MESINNCTKKEQRLVISLSLSHHLFGPDRARHGYGTMGVVEHTDQFGFVSGIVPIVVNVWLFLVCQQQAIITTKAVITSDVDCELEYLSL